MVPEARKAGQGHCDLVLPPDGLASCGFVLFLLLFGTCALSNRNLVSAVNKIEIPCSLPSGAF